MVKKLKISILLLCLLMSGCNNNFQKTENMVSSTIESAAKNQYSYASHLNLDEKTLENLLTIRNNNKEYKLIPAIKSKTHLEYWKNLVSTDKNYIQTFFLHREPLTDFKAILQFNDTIKIMWETEKPDAFLFIVLLNGEYAGIVRCIGLTDEKIVTIGFITAKEYAGQGVATHALKMFVDLIKHLNESKFYSILTASLWIFDDNFASIAVAKKNGFVYVESDAENKRARYSLEF